MFYQKFHYIFVKKDFIKYSQQSKLFGVQMAISEINIKNFKSFNKLDIELGHFSVIIGANGSGKSNFVQIFKFLREIIKSDLSNAIQMQGGIRYLKNIKLSKNQSFSLSIINKYSESSFLLYDKNTQFNIGIQPSQFRYEFNIDFLKRGMNYTIVKDILNIKCKTVKFEKKKPKIIEKSGNIEFIYTRKNGNIRLDLKNPNKLPINEKDILPPLKLFKIPLKSLIIEIPFISYPFIYDELKDIKTYNFDPILSKKATPITGKSQLEEDGSNLSIALQKNIKNPKNKRKLYNLISDLLPFISRLGVDKIADKSILFKVKEVYSENIYLPALFISDGTLNILSMIIALYFEPNKIIIIEEPERHLHPFLLSKVVEMMKDASKDKQIIITTHNPEIVKYAGIENLYLISRGSDGFSKITRPADKKEINQFLKEDIGLDQLFIDQILEAY